ncbi:putative membrane protein [Metabacillus crassostreae]|uniref:hypothetical protein n=1 Tax=Metabacillus crassostreae TaxID=929098 RepID=UPI00195EC4EC|nr:hypothetical protein [Metabacillus crassostreae]MBM7603221.1 putative membrane protein [Metabacillus crassostreae]
MKWKNYGLWVSIASVMYMILKDLGLQIDLTQWETYVTSILGILVTLGIISNPESGKGFFNAKTKSTENDSSTNSTNKVKQSANVIGNSGSVVENKNIQTHQTEVTDTQEIPLDEELMPDRKYAPYEK